MSAKIRLYFAGDANGFPANFPGFGITNRLVSYVYPRQFSAWVSLPSSHGNYMLLDSGAFSAWNKGTVIDINRYIQYAIEAEELALSKSITLRVVNLDVIPGKVGETKSLSAFNISPHRRAQNLHIIEEAAKQGFKNLKIFKKNRITPIHVYHQGERKIWLDRMVDETDYIGVSPANDMPQESKKRWIIDTFEYLAKRSPTTKTHGFAVMSVPLLKDIPWTSCDAASWVLSAGMGMVSFPSPSKELSIITTHSRHLTKNIITRNAVFEGVSIEEVKNSYKHRSLINVRTIQQLEKQLNHYKSLQRSSKSMTPFI